MDYLVFETEAESVTAAEMIYSNMVAAIPSPDLLDVTTDQVIPQEDLNEEQRAEYAPQNRRFPIFGANASTGVKSTTDGYTTAWAIPAQTVQGKWVFQKPDDAVMTGVTGYTVEPYNPDWFPTEVVANG